jgi:2-polyprenyl-6-methoxyphenol hydroxylase-like FAD-dependent oxidoreductase
MNMGIQDAISLARNLNAALHDGNDGRLDLWAAQRHKIARKVVAMTDGMTRIATLKSATGQTLRNMAVALAGRLPPVRAAVAKKLAELDT